MHFRRPALFVLALLVLLTAALLLPATLEAGWRTYCYDSKNACANAQRAASGTKSSCYQQGNQWCYDLFFPSDAEDPEDPVGGEGGN